MSNVVSGKAVEVMDDEKVVFFREGILVPFVLSADVKKTCVSGLYSYVVKCVLMYACKAAEYLLECGVTCIVRYIEKRRKSYSNCLKTCEVSGI